MDKVSQAKISRSRRALGVAVGIGVAVSLALVSFINPAYAELADPTTFEIASVKVFRHMLEPNDFLLVERYIVDYGNSTPAQSIDETFSFLLISSGNNTIGNITAYPFHTQGYGVGLVSFYFDEDNAPTWGGNLTVAIEGQSEYFDEPEPYYSKLVTSSNYSTYTSPADIRGELKDYIIANALILEDAWDLPSDDMVYYPYADEATLSITGTAYFSQVIYDIASICPQALPIQTTGVDIDYQSHSQEYAGNLTNQWAGTNVEKYFNRIASLIGGVGVQTALGIIIIGIIIGLMVTCAIKWQKPTAGILIGYPLLPIWTLGGAFPIGVNAVLALFSVIILGYYLFFRQAAG